MMKDYHPLGESQRDKIARRLNRKATKSVPLAALKGELYRLKEIIPRKSPYSRIQGTDTFSWHLNTTGPSQVDFAEFMASDEGRIYQIKAKWPAGSEFRYYLQLQLDGGIVFPADLSQNLRGDDDVDVYSVDIPFQRGTKVRLTMRSDADLGVNTRMACWADVSVRYNR